MNKVLLSACAGLLLAPAATAQKSKTQRALMGPHSREQSEMLQAVLRLQAPPAAGKTTAQMQRLIGYSSVSGSSLNDSARFTYSSSMRGSDHGNNNLNSYYFNYEPRSVYFPQAEGLIEGGELRIRCDSAVLRDQSGVYNTAGFSYNAATLPTSFRNYFFNTPGSTSSGRERYTMTYNGTGQRTQYLYEVDTVTSGGTGPFIADYRAYSFFGGTPARALRDSIVPTPAAPFSSEVERLVYNYTGNNCTSIDFYTKNGAIFDLVQRLRMTYDGSNRVRTAELLQDMGSTLEPLFKDSLTYTGAYTFPTGTYFLFYDGTSYDLAFSTRYTVNAQGLRDTSRSYDDANTLVDYTVFQYNSFGNLERSRYFDPSTSTTTPLETSRYYYELHDPTGVADAPAPLQATLSPNPVRNTVALTWQAGAGAAQISITDAAGRLQESLTLPASASTHNLDMSRYAPGTYIVRIAAGNGAAQSLKVTKE